MSDTVRATLGRPLQTRRLFLRTVSIGSLGLLAAACSPSASAPAAAPTSAPAAVPTTAPPPVAATAAPTTAGTAATPAAAAASTGSLATDPNYPFPKGPVTITFQHGSDVTTNALYTNVFFPGYTQLHPNVTIQAEAVPSIDQKMLVEFATNAAPTMFEVNANTLQALMSKGLLSAVPPAAWGVSSTEALLSKYYMPKVMDVLTLDGKLYGIPNQMNASSLMINTRLFNAASLDSTKDAPKTWDQVAALNPKLTIRDSSARSPRRASSGSGPVRTPSVVRSTPDLSSWWQSPRSRWRHASLQHRRRRPGAAGPEASLDRPGVTHNTAAVVQQDWATSSTRWRPAAPTQASWPRRSIQR